MTIKKAQSITRLNIEPTPLYRPKFGFLGTDARNFICAWGSGKTESEALQKLVDNNYKRVCDAAMERAKWKCEECSAYTIQAHHVVYRSHGRWDAAENIKILCNACHKKAHKAVKSLARKVQKGIAEARVK